MSDGTKPVTQDPEPVRSRADGTRKVAGAAIVGAAVGALAMKAYLLKRVPNEEPEIAKLAVSLQGHVGRDVTAHLSGVEADVLDRWTSGQEEPDPIVLDRLRSADEAVYYIVQAYGGETAKAWLFGMNRWLNDQAPAHVLRHGDRPEAWKGVVEAAQAFVEL